MCYVAPDTVDCAACYGRTSARAPSHPTAICDRLQIAESGRRMHGARQIVAGRGSVAVSTT